MLNLIQETHLNRQRTRREVCLSVVVGFLLALLFVWIQETEAIKKLALVNAFKNSSTIETVTASERLLEPNAAQETSPTAPLSAQAASNALSTAQRKVSESAAQQVFLERRQAAREDLTEVQEAWLLRRLGVTPNALKLQAQHWQQGQLTWEGLAAQGADLEDMVQALNRFTRWEQVPRLVQIQSSSMVQGATPRQGLAFQLQGRLQAAQGPRP